MRNREVEVVLRELARWRLPDKPSISNGGRHVRISWRLPTGQERTATVSSTPSDWRGARNSRADVRRVLRADGIQLKVRARRPRTARLKPIAVDKPTTPAPAPKAKPPTITVRTRTIAAERLTPALAAIWAALAYDRPTRLTSLARTLSKNVYTVGGQLNIMKRRGLIRNLPDRRGWIRAPIP
jgi:hypothetical protein